MSGAAKVRGEFSQVTCLSHLTEEFNFDLLACTLGQKMNKDIQTSVEAVVLLVDPH